MLSPIVYDFLNKKALVVGGGSIGLRRAQKLRSYGADLTLITPNIRKEHESFKCIEKAYESSDIKGYEIVVAATNDEALNALIVREAAESGVPLINSVTKCDKTTFAFPAVIEEEKIQISINTQGASPAFTKILKKEISEILDEEMLERFRLLTKARRLIKSTDNDHRLIKKLSEFKLDELRKLIKDYEKIRTRN